MSNWLQDHPVFTIVGHTLIVASSAVIFTTFVLDENKINFYKAQSESSIAQINNEKAIAEQYKAKVSVLESEITNLRKVNDRYLGWLSHEKTSFPSLEIEIKNLKSNLDKVNFKLATLNVDKVNGNTKGNNQQITTPILLPYEFSGDFEQGGSFIDPKTKATIGISRISSNYTATGVLHLPGQKRIELSGVKPGETWLYTDSNINYKLILESVNWINNSVKASVIEVK
jgi:hypothetical protein